MIVYGYPCYPWSLDPFFHRHVQQAENQMRIFEEDCLELQFVSLPEWEGHLKKWDVVAVEEQLLFDFEPLVHSLNALDLRHLSNPLPSWHPLGLTLFALHHHVQAKRNFDYSKYQWQSLRKIYLFGIMISHSRKWF
jgi:hypothetical protein